ncbi:MAG: FecR domain-containing protein, partial [Ginsengibacter sp.]
INKAINKIDIEEEWKCIERKTKFYPEGIPSKLVVSEGDLDNRSRKSIFRRMVVSVSVAASIILLVVGYHFFLSKPNPITLAKNDNNLVQSKSSALVRYEINKSQKPKSVTLLDGSVIILSPGSMISFKEPFPENKRDIVLIGEADFKVSKDKTKPFTVFSGEISTTALGTRFIVTAYKTSSVITIRLFEGKVVINSVAAARKKINRDIFLLPGQQLVYDDTNSSAQVSSFKVNKNNKLFRSNKKHKGNNDESNVTMDNTSNANNGTAQWFMFNNQSLPEVFEQLKEMYGVDIIYSKKEIRKMYFIGKFNNTDSIGDILRQIGRLNNLKVTGGNGRFFVKK